MLVIQSIPQVWPRFLAPYIGNRGEQSILEYFDFPYIFANAQEALALYFLRGRFGHWERDTVSWYGAQGDGGLTTWLIAGLGIWGLVCSLRCFRRFAPFYALLAAAFSYPVLSAPFGRRFAVFDIAWAFFAAYGLEAYFSRPSRSFVSSLIVAMGLVASGVWTYRLIGVPLPVGTAEIPFWESRENDHLTCLRCFRLAQEWQRLNEAGTTVVLVDSDDARECTPARPD
jgi:hypothetical protein